MTWQVVRIIVLCILAGAVMILSLVPEPPVSREWFAGMDKIQHWIAYAVLGFLVFATLYRRGRSLLLFYALAVFVCTMYGGLIEVLQELTGREPDVVDFFVNFFGAATGSLAALGVVETSRNCRRN